MSQEMTEKVLYIDSAAALQPLHDHVRRAGPRRYRRLAVEVPELSAEENGEWQERLEKYYLACGCGEGAVGGVLGAVAAGGRSLLGVDQRSWWRHLAAIGLGFVVGSGAGKAAGLARARVKLDSTVTRLEAVIRSQQKEPDVVREEPEAVRCAVE